MSRIVFFCIPAHGHTNPTLNVVRELIRRGHEVWYYSYEIMRSKIEESGAKFIPCDDFDTQQHLSPRDAVRVGKDLAFSTKVLVDTTLALDRSILNQIRELQPDCIVADSMAVWGKAVAMKTGIPFVSSTTTFAFNRYSAKIMKQSPAQLLGMIFSMGRVQKDIRRLQAAGYPVKSILDIIQNDDTTHTIVYTSPEFQPASDTFSPEHYTFVGPSIRPHTCQIEKRREKLIYISMGTVNNDLIPLYKNCVSALAASSHQVIMSVGELVDLKCFGELPDNVEVHPHVDQIAVLEQADLFISHCGMNSANESLYFGVPLIMLPQTPEQGGVAARISQLGAGLLLKKTSPSDIAAAVDEALHNDSYYKSARSIGDGFRRCPGATGAADKILSLCKAQ